MRLGGLLAAIGLALAAVPAAAAEDIEVPSGAVYVHERTGIAFPPRLGEMERSWVRDYGSDRYDVSALYQTADGTTFLSFYVYRAGLPDVSIWFDRVAAIMTARDGFRPASGVSLEPAPYRPAGSETPTGLALAYDIAPGQPNTATGAILFPHGPWLIKLRATSSTMDAATIARVLGEVEQALALPEPEYLSSPAYVVERCTTRLDTGPAAVLAPAQDQVIAVAMLMSGVGESRDTEGNAVPLQGPRWCRDAEVEDLDVYRPDNDADRYVVTFGDSGNALSAGFVMPDLPGVTPRKQGLPIIYADADRSMLMALVDRLPAPAAAWEIAQQADALGTNDRDGNVVIATGGSDD